MEKLSFGVPYTLKQNRVYATPYAGRCVVICSVGGTVLQTSNYSNFSNFIVNTHFSGRHFSVFAPFFRVTTGDVLVLLQQTI